MQIYQAGPLFSEAEREWHCRLSSALAAAGHTVIWPGDLLTPQEVEKAGPRGPKLIFETCKNALDRCQSVVAVLDGPQVDDGAAWEIGYAYARGMPVYGLRTDSRRAGETKHNHVNSMVEACLRGFAGDLKALLRLLE